MNISLSSIRHNKAGFTALVQLWAQTETCFLEDIHIDLSKATWFDADMCAPFGAILHRLSQNLNTIRLLNIHSNVEKILSKNGFLSHFGRAVIPDTWGTTMRVFLRYSAMPSSTRKQNGAYLAVDSSSQREKILISPSPTWVLAFAKISWTINALI